MGNRSAVTSGGRSLQRAAARNAAAAHPFGSGLARSPLRSGARPSACFLGPVGIRAQVCCAAPHPPRQGIPARCRPPPPPPLPPRPRCQRARFGQFEHGPLRGTRSFGNYHLPRRPGAARIAPHARAIAVGQVPALAKDAGAAAQHAAQMIAARQAHAPAAGGRGAAQPALASRPARSVIRSWRVCRASASGPAPTPGSSGPVIDTKVRSTAGPALCSAPPPPWTCRRRRRPGRTASHRLNPRAPPRRAAPA
jgi:hypothetical protein